MSVLGRPPTPGYLRKAAFAVFGEQCLRCGADRPVKVAHIHDWPRCRERAGAPIDDRVPPTDWHMGEAVRLFHDLGNVLPLCSSCHDLYDGVVYDDVDEAEIRGYRDRAVLKSDVLARAIDFVGIELAGRPNRGTDRVTGQRTPAVDPNAVMCVLSWLARGYEQGILNDDPRMIVRTRDGWHFHVSLDTTTSRLCAGDLSKCRDRGWIWQRRAKGSTATPAPSP
ncbi:HNH endonuclease [Kribbella sp. NPDC055071]